MEGTLQRLAAAKIEVSSDLPGYCVLARDGFVCLVERTEAGLANAGSVCKLTEHGFAVILFEGDQAYFVSKGHRQPATPDELHLFQDFSRDLRVALDPTRSS